MLNKLRPNWAVISTLTAIAMWAWLVADSLADAEIRPGDEFAILAACLIVILWGCALVGAARWAKIKIKPLWWISVFAFGTQFVILASVFCLSSDHKGAAILVAAIISLVLFTLIQWGIERQYPDLAISWRLNAEERIQGNRMLKLAFRFLALIAALVCGALAIFMLVKGNVEARIEAALFCCPFTVVLLAIAIGAPSLAQAIRRGMNKAHSLGRDDEE